MCRFTITGTMLFIILWFVACNTALGQNVRGTGQTAPAGSYYASAEARPTVSPYLNLGVTANGISNYQTLVRPLIEERRAIERQSAAQPNINA